jgi:hypothetical protein
VALLLAVIAVQYYALGMRRILIPVYAQLSASLPNVTMALIAKYPGALGFMAILLCAAWLVAAFLVQRGTVVIVINSILLLAVVLFLMLHGLASVLPLGQLGVS